MVQIVWTNRARKDLKQISEYISQDSVKYAKSQLDRIFAKAQILTKLPLAGKVVEEIGDRTIREVIEGNYRIIYRISDSQKISMLAVHHGARSLRNRKLK
jgi:toxin ParE1/3/4